MTSILALDAAGAPHRWLPVEEAIFYQAKALIAWEAGERVFTLYGGTSRATGQRSSLSVRSIVSIAGSTHPKVCGRYAGRNRHQSTASELPPFVPQLARRARRQLRELTLVARRALRPLVGSSSLACRAARTQ